MQERLDVLSETRRDNTLQKMLSLRDICTMTILEKKFGKLKQIVGIPMSINCADICTITLKSREISNVRQLVKNSLLEK